MKDSITNVTSHGAQAVRSIAQLPINVLLLLFIGAMAYLLAVSSVSTRVRVLYQQPSTSATQISLPAPSVNHMTVYHLQPTVMTDDLQPAADGGLLQ